MYHTSQEHEEMMSRMTSTIDTVQIRSPPVRDIGQAMDIDIDNQVHIPVVTIRENVTMMTMITGMETYKVTGMNQAIVGTIVPNGPMIMLIKQVTDMMTKVIDMVEATGTTTTKSIPQVNIGPEILVPAQDHLPMIGTIMRYQQRPSPKVDLLLNEVI